jgi:hypothetical protein
MNSVHQHHAKHNKSDRTSSRASEVGRSQPGDIRMTQRHPRSSVAFQLGRRDTLKFGGGLALAIGTILYFLPRETLADYGASCLIAPVLLAIAAMPWRPRGIWRGSTHWQLLCVRRASGIAGARQVRGSLFKKI